MSVDNITQQLARDGTRPAKRPDGWPTRGDMSLWTEAEHKISQTVEVVERAGASKALTDAVILLNKARERVADHVEGKGNDVKPGDPGTAVLIDDPSKPTTDPLRKEIQRLRIQLEQERITTERQKKLYDECMSGLREALKKVKQHEADHKTLGDEEVARIERANAKIAALEKENADLKEEVGLVAETRDTVAQMAGELERVGEELRLALLCLGPSRQFPTPCFCETAAPTYCVGQQQCKHANKVIKAWEKLVPHPSKPEEDVKPATDQTVKYREKLDVMIEAVDKLAALRIQGALNAGDFIGCVSTRLDALEALANAMRDKK